MAKLLELIIFGGFLYWIYIKKFRNPSVVVPRAKKRSSEKGFSSKMVRCQFCSLGLPQDSALRIENRFYCSDEHMSEIDKSGWLGSVRWKPSPNFDNREGVPEVDTVVIHHISLPKGVYGDRSIEEFFCNQLDPLGHPEFDAIKDLQVSAHFLIKRTGQVTQFVSCQKRAWHAGKSEMLGRERCNDFSLGIELEGTGEDPFTEKQYHALVKLFVEIKQLYNIRFYVGHSDISPDRKTDPGQSFDWKLLSQLAQIDLKELPFGLESR